MARRDRVDTSSEVGRRLTAMDAALADAPVEPDLIELEELVHAVRAERPRPIEAFSERLDRRVAERFADGPGRARAGKRGRWTLPGVFGRHMLLSGAGALASLLVVVVVVTAALRGGGLGPSGEGGQTARPLPADKQSSQKASGKGAAVPPAFTQSGQQGGANRRVERQASLALTAPTDRIDEVADGVVRVTDQVGGIVASSNVQSADDGQGGASFELSVPARRLGEALASLSKLAHVQSRTQSSLDVTEPYTSAADRLRESLAERSSLLRQLAAATASGEMESIRSRLRIVNSQIASRRAQVARMAQRSNFASVSVSIGPDSNAGGASGPWTPSDALHDAARILEVAAGVLLVALALLIPFAVVGLTGGLALRGLRRRRREQALQGG